MTVRDTGKQPASQPNQAGKQLVGRHYERLVSTGAPSVYSCRDHLYTLGRRPRPAVNRHTPCALLAASARAPSFAIRPQPPRLWRAGSGSSSAPTARTRTSPRPTWASSVATSPTPPRKPSWAKPSERSCSTARESQNLKILCLTCPVIYIPWRGRVFTRVCTGCATRARTSGSTSGETGFARSDASNPSFLPADPLAGDRVLLA